MAEEPIVLALQAKDEASAIFQRIDALVKGLSQHFGATKTAAKDAENAASGWSRVTPALMGIGIAGAAAAVGVALVAKTSIDSASEYQSALADLAASSSIPLEAANKIGDAFLDMSGKTIFSAKQSVDALAPLTGEIQLVTGHTINASDATKIMAASMNLAESSATDLNSATRDVVSVMKVYHLTTGQASMASDMLYETARLTGQSVDAVATSVDRLEGRLGPLGPSLSDVSTLMVELNKHGVEGRMAMMASTAGMNTLLSGSKGVTAELHKLNITVFDSHGKFVGMRDIIAQLQPKLATMTEQQRLMAERMLFGATAGRELDAVILAGTKGYDQISAVINKHNAAQAAAEQRSKTFVNEQKQLNATLDDAKVMIGTQLLPVIQDLLKAVIPVVVTIVQWINHHRQLTAAILIAVGALGALVAVAAAVALVMMAVSLPILGIVLAIGLLVAGIILIVTHFTELRQFLGKLWEEILAKARASWGALSKAIEGFVGGIWMAITGWAGRMLASAENLWSQFSARPIFWIVYLMLEAMKLFVQIELAVARWGLAMEARALNMGLHFALASLRFIQELPGRLGSLLAEVIVRVARWEVDMARKALELGAQFFHNVSSFDWVGLGVSIIMGILNGVKGAVASKVHDFANAAGQIKDAFKKALNIGSPSMTMAVEVGKPMMEGTLMGMQSALPAARTQLGGITASLLNARTSTAQSSSGGTDQQVVALLEQLVEILSAPVEVRGAEASLYALIQKVLRGRQRALVSGV